MTGGRLLMAEGKGATGATPEKLVKMQRRRVRTRRAQGKEDGAPASERNKRGSATSLRTANSLMVVIVRLDLKSWDARSSEIVDDEFGETFEVDNPEVGELFDFVGFGAWLGRVSYR